VRRSLNTPVLSISQLPVGPASAAIATHLDAIGGTPHYTLAVRCARSGESVFFSASEDDLAHADSSMAGEAALSLAEGMGFLFEEDLPPICGEAAVSIWEEFAGSADPSPGVERSNAAPPLLTKFRRGPAWAAAVPAVEPGHETHVAQPGDR